MFKAMPANLALPALVAGLAAWAPAVWAGGYLSGYSGGSSQYLSDYSSGGGYSGGYGGGYVYYGGDRGGSYSGGHSDSYAGDIPPKYWSAWSRSKRHGDRSAWSLFGVSPAAGNAQPCGTYNRAPARCFRATTKYDPAIHGLGSVRY